MADMSVETSRIRDVVRDSKIRSDISSMLNQSSDSFLLGSFQGLAEQRHHRTRDVHRVGRDFPRVSADEVVRKVLRCNSREENKRLDFNFKFDEGESWVHGWNGNEDPFNEFYDGYSDSDSLIVRFKRNLPDFVGFWHMEDLLTWIDAIDDFFEEVSPPEHVKCKIVLYKMKGAAYYWWRRLQADRNEIGKDEIISWPRMKNLLLKRFSPTKCSTKCPSQQNQKVEEGMEVVKDLKADKFTPNNCSTKVSGEPDRIKPSKKDDDESLCASGMSAYEIHHYLGPNKAVHFDTCKDSECEKPSSNVAITEEFEFGDATPEQPSQEEVNQLIILNAQTVEGFLGEHDSQDNINTNVAEKTMSTCDEMETLKEISGILAISSNGTGLMQEIMVDELKKVEFIPTSICLDDVMKINPTPVIVSEMDLASSNSTPEKYSEPKALSWKIIAYCDGVFENHFEKGTKSQSVGVGGNAKVVGFLFDPGGIDDVQSLHIVIIRLDSFGLIFSEVNVKEGFIMSSLSIAMTRTLQELVYHVTGEILQTTYSLDWTVSFLSLAGHPPNAIETFVEALELMPHEKSLNETLKGCFTDEFGVLFPNQLQVNELYVWEVGYLSASIKSIGNAREGDIQDKYDSKIELELQHKVTCMHSRHLPIGASIITKRFWEPIYGPNNQNSELSHEERGCIRIDDLQWMSRVAVVLEFFLDDNTCRSTCLNRGECMIFSHYGTSAITFLFDPGGSKILPIRMFYSTDLNAGTNCSHMFGVLRVSCGCFIFLFVMFLTTCRTSKMCYARNIWHFRGWKKYSMPDEEKRNVAFTDLVSKEEYACWEAPVVSNIEMLRRQFAEVNVSLAVHGENLAGSLKPEIDEYYCFIIIIVQSPWHLKCFTKELLQRSLLRHAYEDQKNATTKDVKGMDMLRKGVWANLKQQFGKTRGRVIPREDWTDAKDPNIEGQIIMVKLSIIAASCLLHVVTLKLFHNVVNGLDPPMDLDRTCGAYEIDMPATYHVFKIVNVHDDAQTEEIQLEDEFVILGADGDDAA